jgi:4-amino-4-deoxy-L-arabinose transferase-like glycosyltransferase
LVGDELHASLILQPRSGGKPPLGAVSGCLRGGLRARSRAVKETVEARTPSVRLSGDGTPFRPPAAWASAILLAAAVAMVLARNRPWDCMNGFDQSKQAFVPLVMLQEGAWWFQYLPDGLPATKPPLMGWLSAVLYRVLGGWWAGAWRGPSILAFSAVLCLLLRAGRRAAGYWGAWVAAGVFALNMLTVRIATLIRTDMLLALEVFAVGLLVWRRLSTGTPWRARDRWTLFAVVLAGCFTKGPVIYAFTLPSLLAWRWLARRRGERDHAWPGWWPWMAPFLLLGAWAAAGGVLNEAFFHRVVFREFGNNFASIRLDEAGPVARPKLDFSHALSYALQLIHRLLPWSLALVAWFAADRAGRRRLLADPASRWLAVWVGVSLGLMMLVPNKRADRIFPIVPPIALLAAAAVRCASWDRWPARPGRRLLYGLAASAAILWGGYTIAFLRGAPRGELAAEAARYDFFRAVRAWSEREGCVVKAAGPGSDGAQSTLVYLRATRWIAEADIDAERRRGAAVVATALMMRGRPGPVLLRQSDGGHALLGPLPPERPDAGRPAAD